MAEDKKMGVFWGKNALFFVETSAGKPGRVLDIPLGSEASGSIQAGPFSPAGMEIISLIQNSFRQHKFTPSTISISLPPKDIIFRSFIIPWMQPNEIKGVVDFEASKYVPFALSDLAFSFYPATIIDGNTRRIRIIFVAIKRVVLESYVKILEQASFRIQVTEPATISLIRALVAKDLLPKDETIALIEQGEEAGNIVVVDNHLPQFVREFQLRIPGADQGPADPQVFMTRMINEVRISLNYFNRQEERFKVKRVMFLTSFSDTDIVGRLEEDLHMPVTAITTDSILANPQATEVHFFKAYGAALHQSVDLPANLNFSETRFKSIKMAAVRSAPARTIQYKTTALVALICLPIIGLSLFFWGTSTQKQESRKAALSAQLKSLKDVSAQKLKQDNEKLSERLDYFRGLLIPSDVASFLVLIPRLLPEGVWIEEINIVPPSIIDPEKDKKNVAAGKGKPAEGRPAVDIKGYAYSSNPNDQFKLAYDLLAKFKQNKEFSALFESIDFETIQAQNFGKYPSTFFHLKCR